MNLESNESIGRDPLRQLPGKWSSDIVCTVRHDGQLHLLILCMFLTILKMHLDSRSIRRFAHPYVEIFALPRLKEQNVIAIVQLGKFVELVELCLCVQLRVFATVWE